MFFAENLWISGDGIEEIPSHRNQAMEHAVECIVSNNNWNARNHYEYFLPLRNPDCVIYTRSDGYGDPIIFWDKNETLYSYENA